MLSTEERTSEAPTLTDAYRKAHKNYVLWSALLASWELIGIELQTKEKWGISLKSPDAVPVILLVLVLYSGYKITIEWVQCDGKSRSNFAAQLDFRIAHIIASLALTIAFIQYLLHVRIFEIISRPLIRATGLLAVATILVPIAIPFWYSQFKEALRDPYGSTGAAYSISLPLGLLAGCGFALYQAIRIIGVSRSMIVFTLSLGAGVFSSIWLRRSLKNRPIRGQSPPDS
jgi:hypothetical protein